MIRAAGLFVLAVLAVGCAVDAMLIVPVNLSAVDKAAFRTIQKQEFKFVDVSGSVCSCLNALLASWYLRDPAAD